MRPREKLTLDELQRLLKWSDPVGTGLELLRRLRAVVPVLEEIQAARWNPTRHDAIAETLAIVKGAKP